MSALRELLKNVYFCLVESIGQQVYNLSNYVFINMQLLSLFDGIGVAGLAVKSVFVDFNYQASEIDKTLVKFTGNQFPGIKHLGDIKSIDTSQINKPDILICGSPCQDLSNAGKRKGLTGDRSSLFWDAVPIRDTVNPEYWLFENVVSSNANLKIMSDALGVAPIIINSRHFTYQDRLRCYWCNFDVKYPNWTLRKFPDVKIVKKCFGRWRMSPYFPTLTRGIKTCDWKIQYDDGELLDIPWEHYESAQGLPCGYTQSLPSTIRRQALANCFTLPVVEYLLKHLL